MDIMGKIMYLNMEFYIIILSYIFSKFKSKKNLILLICVSWTTHSQHTVNVPVLAFWLRFNCSPFTRSFITYDYINHL